MLQVLGFVGSTLIILSVTMRSIIRIRIIGLLGAAAFISYGVALDAWPVVATNAVTSCIHVYHLRALLTEYLAAKPEGRWSSREPAPERTLPPAEPERVTVIVPSPAGPRPGRRVSQPVLR